MIKILEIEKPKPKPACAKRLVFSNFEKSDSDLNGFWSHVVIDGKVQENEGYPYYQQEGVNKKAKPFMWWMWHGDNGHWVVNMTPGKNLYSIGLFPLVLSTVLVFIEFV